MSGDCPFRVSIVCAEGLLRIRRKRCPPARNSDRGKETHGFKNKMRPLRKSDGYGENDGKNRAKSPAFPDENGFRLADQRIILFAGQNVFLFANRNVSSVDLSARCPVFRAAPGSLRYFTPRSRSGSSTASSTGRGTSR